MKLRIRGNTLRFRLTQTEVEALGKGIAVTDKTSFGGNRFLSYELQPVGGWHVSFDRQTISIGLPSDAMKDWANSEDKIGVEQTIDLGNGETLFIAIEKDFQCLNPRGAEDEDTFPNPGADSLKC